MSRGSYSPAKRQREADQARRKEEKAQKRLARRDRGPGQVEIVSAEEIIGSLPSVSEAVLAIEERARTSRSAPGVPMRLFAGGLSDTTTAEHLRKAFSAFGTVSDAFVVTDRDTGASRGFGFVTMENSKDAPAAIEALNGTALDGSTLVVNVATERPR
jgi:RNA recognition motif-containing protein